MAVYRPGATLFDDPRISTAGVRPAIPEVGGGGGGFFGGLLGGGGGDVLDLYGDLFTPEQKKALKRRELTQGLFRMAEKLGAAAQPTRAPTSLGGTLGALGAGLGAFGSGGTGEETALKGMEVAE